MKNDGLCVFFLSGFDGAVNSTDVFSKLSGTITSRFQKNLQKISLAFVPLGNAILDVIEPIIPPFVSFIEMLGEKFSALSPAIQSIIVAFGAVAAVLGPVLVVLGSIAGAVSSIIAIG